MLHFKAKMHQILFPAWMVEISAKCFLTNWCIYMYGDNTCLSIYYNCRWSLKQLMQRAAPLLIHPQRSFARFAADAE